LSPVPISTVLTIYVDEAECIVATVTLQRVLVVADQTAVLQGHTGMVKGVTWDPIGKYLASQSDDRTVRVWRTYNWKSETVVSEPFKEVCIMSTGSQAIHNNNI